MPGPGYFPFGAELLLGIISLSVLINTLRKAPQQFIEPVNKTGSMSGFNYD